MVRPSSKYHTDERSEFEPGSRGRILKNLRHITSVRELQDVELEAYIKAEQNLVDTYSEDHQFTVEDLHLINKMFLGEIYPWAGTYRTVNLSKGGFPFATAFAIPEAMEKFEQGILSKNTPCNVTEIGELSRMIALVHVEFLLIHPYREGNGRTARLLATLSAYQAGMPGIDFSFIRGRGKEFDRYIRAIQLGIKEEYGLMQEIIERALRVAQQSTRGA